VKAGARVDASGVGNHLSLPPLTLQAIGPCTSNAWKPSGRKPQSATFFARARAEIPDAIGPDVLFRLFRDKQRRLRHGGGARFVGDYN